MAQIRRKDIEGLPTNGGQYAGQTHDHADSIALDRTTEPNYAWPAIDGVGSELARIAYGGDETCVCKNTNARDGFVPTDAQGNLHDDEDTAGGLICLVCGRFYRVDPTIEAYVDVVPSARFDVSATAFQDAFDAYWERNF